MSVAESFFVIFTDIISGRATQIKDPAVIQHSDVAIISRRNFQAKNPVLDSIAIHFHNHWLLWFFFRFLGGRPFFRLFLFLFFCFFLLSFFISFSDFVALWSVWVLCLFCQCDEINDLQVAIYVCKLFLA